MALKLVAAHRDFCFFFEPNASAVSVGVKGRGDVAVGARVFHSKSGYGAVTTIKGNKLEIEKAGSKRMPNSFVGVV